MKTMGKKVAQKRTRNTNPICITHENETDEEKQKMNGKTQYPNGRVRQNVETNKC